MTFNRYKIFTAPLLLASLAPQVYARGEITHITTELVAAIPSSYTVDGQTYEWGNGEDLILKSIEYNGKSIEYNKFKPDTVIVRRVANSKSTGAPCSVFAQNLGDNHKLAPSYPPTDSNGKGNCDYAKVVSSEVLNRGTLDLFANAVREKSIKNIERVDLVFSYGITTPATGLDESGHVVIEKSGNNHVQVAAIRKLDAEGNPSSYGPLVMVNPSNFDDSSKIRYGIAYGPINVTYLANENKAPQGYLKAVGSLEETLGIAFVSASDLGLGTNETYYGISLFSADVDSTKHTLTDPTTFPLNTGANDADDGDADLIVGTAGDFTVGIPPTSSNGQPPKAVEGNSNTKDVIDIVEDNANKSGGGSGAMGIVSLLLVAGGAASRRQRRKTAFTSKN